MPEPTAEEPSQGHQAFRVFRRAGVHVVEIDIAGETTLSAFLEKFGPRLHFMVGIIMSGAILQSVKPNIDKVGGNFVADGHNLRTDQEWKPSSVTGTVSGRPPPHAGIPPASA